MCLGFQHDDGWFGIAAALSTAIANAAPAAQVKGWKTKFIDLRIWLDNGNARCEGAIRAANRIALRLSERSGRPGRPMLKPPRSTKVLAPDEAPDWQPVDPQNNWLDGEWTATRLRARHTAILAHAEIAVPPPVLFLVDAFLDALPTGMSLARIDLQQGPRAANGTILSPEMQGATDFLTALAPLLHVETGAIGPVDDTGQLIPGGNAIASGTIGRNTSDQIP